MTTPGNNPTDGRLSLSEALQHAFTEAGNPSLRTVAASGTGVTRQRLSDWRAGRHVPAKFSDLEPVLAYLYLAAETNHPSPATDAERDRVTQWPLSQWHQTWKHAATAATARPAIEAQAPANSPIDHDQPDTVDRRPLALAIVTLVVILVAALAIAAFVISSLTM